MKDIHLAAVEIGGRTKAAIENLGFTEDFFVDCENCSPTSYHATFRGDEAFIDDDLWAEVVGILEKDDSFSGALELEEGLQTVFHEGTDGGDASLVFAASPLAIQACPAGLQKSCDVHLGVRLDGSETRALIWLRDLHIASFQKERSDGSWRIFTATFDTLDAGVSFFKFATEKIGLIHEVTWKAKLEQTERLFRQPANAPTLPITYSRQLTDWLVKEGAWEKSGSS